MNSHASRSILVRVGLQTLVGVAASVAMTAALLMAHAGVDFAATLPVEHVWMAALAVAAICPALLVPLVAWPAAQRLSDLQRARDEMADAAFSDPLTGLLNRRGFDEAATLSLAKSTADSDRHVAIMCDIDHFKSINDRYGHDFGDIALIQTAAMLEASLEGRPAVIGRLGGEEFAILLPDCDPAEAGALAEALRAGCAGASIRCGGVEARVTLSFGVAVANAGERELRALLVRADGALYRAKSEGRNRVVWAADERRAA